LHIICNRFSPQHFVKNGHKKKNHSIDKSHFSYSYNKMKLQFSLLVALALLGASLMVQFVDAAVCPDECSVGGRTGVNMCKNGKNQCVTRTNQQRNILKKGGNCGVCTANRNRNVGVSNDGPFPKCSQSGQACTIKLKS